MKIVLIGYMGSGKSAISQKLSDKLDYKVIDLDDYIEEMEGNKISDIFATKGPIYFRKKESEYLKLLMGKEKSMILALGGGTPCYSNNLEYLKSLPDIKIIYLKGSVSLLADRLFLQKDHRPLIANIETKEQMLEFVGKHLFERSPYYSQADEIIVTDGKSIDEVASEIHKGLF